MEPTVTTAAAAGMEEAASNAAAKIFACGHLPSPKNSPPEGTIAECKGAPPSLDAAAGLGHGPALRRRKGARLGGRPERERAVGRSGAAPLRRGGGAARHRASTAAPFWAGFEAPAPRADAGEPAAARPARRTAGADRRAQRGAGRPSPRSGRGRSVPARDRLSGRRRRRPSRSAPRTSTRRSPRSPGRSSSSRSATPAMRSTRSTPAGAASTTRSTAPTRWASLPEGGGYDPKRGAPGDRLGPAHSSTRSFRSNGGSHADVADYRVEDGRLVTDLGGLADPSRIRRLAAMAASCSATTASTSRS